MINRVLKKLEQNDKIFLGLMLLVAIIIILVYGENRMNIQNCATYLFSYEYGLIPRGLIGTIISAFMHLLGMELHYSTELKISALATIVYFICLFALYFAILKRTEEKYKYSVRVIMFFFSIFSFTEYITWNNYGRMDEYLTIILLLCVILLIKEKWEWMIVPLCFIACLIHTGFVFTHAGLILAILFWKIVRDQKINRKYLFIFISTFTIVSFVFLYMQVLRDPVSLDSYTLIEQKSIELAEEGGNQDYLPTVYSLLDSELLRKDVYDYESLWHSINRKEVPVFMVLFIPYLIVLVKILYNALKKNGSIFERLGSLALVFGIVTIVPELILKVDFGRWFFCIIMYYALMLMIMIALKNKSMAEAVENVVTKNKSKLWMVMIVYAFLFVPLRDVLVSDFTYAISVKLFGM